jgi:Zn-dependent alcohol dehydrogenase
MASVEGPRPNEVSVRIVGTGICQTDAHIGNQEYSTHAAGDPRP